MLEDWCFRYFIPVGSIVKRKENQIKLKEADRILMCDLGGVVDE